MITDSYFTYKSDDGTVIAARKWMPPKRGGEFEKLEPSFGKKGAWPRATLQIVHGMAEHIGRYEAFAETLARYGIVVAGCDLRGHGQTAGTKHKLGHMTGNWLTTLQDVKQLHDHLKQAYPGIPHFLMGHSFGSMVARAFVRQYGACVDGLILSGTSASRQAERKLGAMLAGLQSLIFPGHARAHVLQKLAFLGYNRGLTPRRYPFDWLSRDPEAVRRYMQDPYCGQVCSINFYRVLFQVMAQVFDDSQKPVVSDAASSDVSAITADTPAARPAAIGDTPHAPSLPPHFPVLIFAGDHDPVGGAAASEAARDDYKHAGLIDVTCTIYKGGRHEMLNEINCADVYTDILTWLDARID